jgi:cytochrome c
MRSFCAHSVFALIMALMALPTQAMDAGAKLYKKHCKLCHTIGKGEAARQGPNLWGVFNRPAGSVAGFKYSKAFKATKIVWTHDNLDAWLTDPKALIPGSVMLYKQKDPEIRQKIIEFVATAQD